MILSGQSLSVAQACPRRFVLEASEPRGRWHPKALFDATFRQALLALSSGKPKEEVASQATTKFRALAKNPGLATLSDPWALAQDFCSTLRTLVEALSRLTLPTLKVPEWVPLQEGSNGELGWLCGSFADDSGALHRWTSVASLTEDSLAQETHGWPAFGDHCVTRQPTTLHIVEIGSIRAGRRHSPWCKIYKHPAVAGVWQFQRKGGRNLGERWNPVWFHEASAQSPEKWVDQQEKDGLTLIHHFQLKEATPEQQKAALVQIRAEGQRLAALPKDFHEIPMSRGACDSPYVCPHQWRCYGEGNAMPSQGFPLALGDVPNKPKRPRRPDLL